MPQFAIGSDAEDSDAVVKPVRGVQEVAVLRDDHFGGEVRADKISRQARDHLSLRQNAARIVEQEECGRLFLKRRIAAPVESPRDIEPF